MKTLKSSLFSKFEKSTLSNISNVYGGIKYTRNKSNECDTLEGTTIKVTACTSSCDGGDSHPASSWGQALGSVIDLFNEY